MILQIDLLGNIGTVAGLLAAFAAVIAFLFKLYDNSQENRLNEMKENLNNQIVVLRAEMESEKKESKELRDKFDSFVANDHQKMVMVLQENNALLARMK